MRALLVVAFLLPLGTGAILSVRYEAIPELLPIHFGITGQADEFAPKSVWRVFAPILGAIGSALLGSAYAAGWLPDNDAERRVKMLRISPWLALMASAWFCFLATGPL